MQNQLFPVALYLLVRFFYIPSKPLLRFEITASIPLRHFFSRVSIFVLLTMFFNTNGQPFDLTWQMAQHGTAKIETKVLKVVFADGTLLESKPKTKRPAAKKK